MNLPTDVFQSVGTIEKATKRRKTAGFGVEAGVAKSKVVTVAGKRWLISIGVL